MEAVDVEQRKSQWLEEVKVGNSQAVEALYRLYRDEFVAWLEGQNECTQAEALDVFQESVLALYKNIKSGKLTSLQSSIKTYLFGIGKRIYINLLRKRKIKLSGMDDVESVKEIPDVPSCREDAKDEQEAFIWKTLKSMKDPCYTILYLFYYRKLKLKVITQRLNYRNPTVTSIQKGRCIKALRKATLKKFG